MRDLISTEVLESEEAAEYGSIDNDGDSSDEEDESVLGQAGVIIGVTQSGTEEVEDVERVVKITLFCPIYWNLRPYSQRDLTRIRRHRRSSSTICVILGNGKSGGIGEEPSVPILTLISAMINNFWSIQSLWTVSQVK